MKFEPAKPQGGRRLVTAFGAKGFRFGGERIEGSCLLLEADPEPWAPTRIEEVDEAAVAGVLALSGRISFFLLGTGATMAPPAKSVREALAQAGLGLEWMDTAAACRVHNTLISEGRAFAAGFLAVA